MPAHERVRAFAHRQVTQTALALGREARDQRLRTGLSQQFLASATGISRDWIHHFEHGALHALDLRRATSLMAYLGHRLVVTTYPAGEPIRDEAQSRLLQRFNARLSPTWRRHAEAPMPGSGDLRAWDEVLRGPVSIGVEAETRPRDLQALTRHMHAKQRDSGVMRIVLVTSATSRNRQLVRAHLPLIRQTFPLDTRTTLAALTAGCDPGGNGLVVL